MILWINIDYLRKYKDFKEKIRGTTSEEQLGMKPGSLTVVLINIFFNFIRRWLIYILTIIVTGNNIIVIAVSLILFVISLYDIFFNNSLERMKKSNLKYTLAVADVIYIIIFSVYLFVIS